MSTRAILIVFACACALPGEALLIGVSDGLGRVGGNDVCEGHRCDTGACPCGCECGSDKDPGLCYVPKGLKRAVRWMNQSLDVSEVASTSSTASRRENGSQSVSGNSSVVSTPNGVIAIDTSSGSAKVLHPLEPDVAIFYSALDPENDILYLWWGVMNQVLPFALRNSTMLKPVNVDISQCEGGSGCYNEIQWDARRGVLVAIAIGFKGPQNAVVSIDPRTGAVSQLSDFFSRECALYLQCSTYDSESSTFFAWLACSSTPTAQLYGISTARGGGNKTLLSVSFRDVIGPMVFDTLQKAPLGVGADGRLYQYRETTPPNCCQTQCLAAYQRTTAWRLYGMGGPSSTQVFASLVDLSKSKLCRSAKLLAR